jgi:hypothetical protein
LKHKKPDEVLSLLNFVLTVDKDFNANTKNKSSKAEKELKATIRTL